MSERFIAHDGSTFRCYSTVDGRTKTYLGCLHGTPRAAIAHTVPVYVSPTRSESGSSYPSGEGRQAPLGGEPFSEASGQPERAAPGSAETPSAEPDHIWP